MSWFAPTGAYLVAASVIWTKQGQTSWKLSKAVINSVLNWYSLCGLCDNPDQDQVIILREGLILEEKLFLNLIFIAPETKLSIVNAEH